VEIGTVLATTSQNFLCVSEISVFHTLVGDGHFFGLQVFPRRIRQYAQLIILPLFWLGLCYAQSNPLENKFNKAERLFQLDNWVEADQQVWSAARRR